MNTALSYDQLQAEHADLKADHSRLTAALKAAELKLAKYEEERRLERARRFGASSEAGDYQANLFDEAEANADEVEGDADLVEMVEVSSHTKRRPKREVAPFIWTALAPITDPIMGSVNRRTNPSL